MGNMHLMNLIKHINIIFDLIVILSLLDFTNMNPLALIFKVKFIFI